MNHIILVNNPLQFNDSSIDSIIDIVFENAIKFLQSSRHPNNCSFIKNILYSLLNKN